MSGLTNHIERFLKELLEESEGIIEIGRNDLAEQFGCAPSQINYVLSTRFTPYKGYFIESRRGGSGYIKIIKLTRKKGSVIDLLLSETIGSEITKDKARMIIESLLDEGIITPREYHLMIHSTEDISLASVPGSLRNTVRAEIMKNMLLVFLR
ncbi:CtsR family transcriptional regulator [Microaceticoccus formicicus]|uniref:CtsR family transcriptional regulator n=1 Tax=Microaceticoccus formicicus TaxID=3118105 RepID=UPI003CD0171B|nr:CtsR family transcriptional regulator [Peptoniphilaceae bacterium AMB_02]